MSTRSANLLRLPRLPFHLFQQGACLFAPALLVGLRGRFLILNFYCCLLAGMNSRYGKWYFNWKSGENEINFAMEKYRFLLFSNYI